MRDLVVSQRQFARPAVVLSFLDQIIWTPPVEAESSAIRPEVILVSSSVRKLEAISCFVVEKAFLASFVMREGFMGLGFWGEKRRRPSEGLGIGWRVFIGEYWSFQSLTTS